MYELIPLTAHDYYIDCPAKIGVVDLGDGRAVCIDSGSDKDAAKKLLRRLEERGWILQAVYNTHAHADHIGGNNFLQEKTGCAIYAGGIERAYAAYPQLEPAGLYGGLPFSELRNKFLMARESRVQPLTEAALPAGWQLLYLPGHSPDMAGFLTPEGTAYIADSVSSEETLQKYGIMYTWNQGDAVRTLEALPQIKAERFVPAHAPVVTDIRPLAQANLAALEELKNRVLRLCAEPVSFEALLKELFAAYGLTMTVQQHALTGSTVRSLLAWLRDTDELQPLIRDNTLLWQRTEE